jgi:dihydrofolate synthase/folylpolyglutamate synthase
MIDKRQTELFCEWLENYLDYEKIKKKGDFSLETMKFLVERFKHPERAFKSVHIAGSKGKGSVSTMIANILEAAGKPTGLYTSPHLLDFTERISTPSGPFSDALYGKACDIVVPLVDSIIPGSIPGNLEPTWFELVTLFSFVTFREAGLEWAVIETGMGGRLDATNVIRPEASVITPIELEHTEYLGDTIEKIAAEKAGIIKDGVPVFISEQKSAARSVFVETASRRGSPLFSMEDAIKNVEAHVSAEGLDISVTFNNLAGGPVFVRPLNARLALLSEVQTKNAALAAYVTKYLYPDLDETIIELGLSRSWLPGRFEIVPGATPVILDGAHTVRSITLTLATLKKIYPGDAHLLFACAADKDVESMAALLKNMFSRITLTKPGLKKASDIDRAAAAFNAAFGSDDTTNLHVDGDYIRAIGDALDQSRAAGVPLLVTGSFYLVAEVKRLLATR